MDEQKDLDQTSWVGSELPSTKAFLVGINSGRDRESNRMVGTVKIGHILSSMTTAYIDLQRRLHITTRHTRGSDRKSHVHP